MSRENLAYGILFFLLCIGTIFISSLHFVSQEIRPKWYMFYSIILLGFGMMIFTTKSIKIRYDNISISLLIFTMYVLAINPSMPTQGISSGFQYSYFLLLFLIFKIMQKEEQRIVYYIIICVCFLQSIYGILQFFYIINHNYSFPIVGTFDNPAGFAATISTGFVYCFAIIGKEKRLNSIAIIAMSVIGIGIILSESRAGMITIFTVILIFLQIKFSHKISKKAIIYSTILTLLSLVIIALFYKLDSAIGRILIWENTINMILQKPTLGWKNVTFESQYMLHQADYFKNHPNSPFLPLADNVSHPFHELLLFLFQYGFIGLILLIVVACAVFKKRDKNNIIYLLSIFSILLFGCFSYPLRYPFVWVILALCLAKLSNNSENGKKNYELNLNAFPKILAFIIISSGFYFLINDVRFEYSWNKTARLSLMGNTKEMIENYKKLNDNWNGNPLFLYNYGAELNFVQEYKKSTQVLNKCISYWNDYDIQMILADNYFNVENWGLSKKSYELASKMCPSRFEPLYKLHQINIEQGHIDSANIIAKKIISMDIKIPSSRISFIKDEMEIYLHRK